MGLCGYPEWESWEKYHQNELLHRGRFMRDLCVFKEGKWRMEQKSPPKLCTWPRWTHEPNPLCQHHHSSPTPQIWDIISNCYPGTLRASIFFLISSLCEVGMVLLRPLGKGRFVSGEVVDGSEAWSTVGKLKVGQDPRFNIYLVFCRGQDFSSH